MKLTLRLLFATLLSLALFVSKSSCDDFAAPLSNGVRAVWGVNNAFRETTASRERVCVNGLWRWQPADIEPKETPSGNWGYFKVPGCWPGITDYMQKDCQTVVAHPTWQDQQLASINAAWYEREITVPADWKGRRISLSVEYLNSFAVVYVDGKRLNAVHAAGKPAGEMRFPGGELELTSVLVPGRTHRLTLHVAALPLKGVLLSYRDSNSARDVQGRVQRRGLCGDVFLVSTPIGERIDDVKIDTSVRKGEIRFESKLAGLEPAGSYSLYAEITDGGKRIREFASEKFTVDELQAGRFAFSAKWRPDRLWDIHTPDNQYDVTVKLRRAAYAATDAEDPLDKTFRKRFGFREFWIDDKNFYLNGTRIFLSVVPLDNAQVGAAWASYEGARESFRRLRSFGINFVYTHNYGCEPGSHLSFSEILRAADDEGMLVALSQPHFSHYEWDAADADDSNGYARHAEFYVRAAENHPAVVAYSMSHNACGYGEDMNPDMIDGLRDPRTADYERRNANRALRAEAIVKRFDSTRIVYHHAGGDLGVMHTANFYPNFVPIQEMSDWFEHWATVGAKPAFLCEYGAPFLWDWAMYRGWYKGEREFGSAVVPWDFCLAEWNSQFIGDRAFQISEYEKANLRWEAKQFRDGRLWHRWDYPQQLGSKVFDERYPIVANYITDNWRSFRTWGLSAFSPWEHGAYWRLRDGVNRGRRQLAVDWQALQRPGFSADYLDRRYERMDLAYDQSDWEPTPAATALLRNNLPLLGYIAGKPESFTSKDHLFVPGEAFTKQAIVINNSRHSVECECSWSLGLPTEITGREQVSVQTGEQVRIPLTFTLPATTVAGTYELRASFEFSSGETQEDSFAIHVLAAPESQQVVAGMPERKIALFDPLGETAAQLTDKGVKFQSVELDAKLDGYELFIVGKSALTVDGPAPDLGGVRDGLRVIVFEQTSEVLEKRFGFRVAEYGLRSVFRRVPDHSLLSGFGQEHLRDWRGSATILPPRLTYKMRPRHGPTVRWCDIEVPRLWRCGNRGNVASVLIEKPARGDFRPIVDGGYSLQYSPLMEYREGRGMILFCQLDVTGRTESEPVAEKLVDNLLAYVHAWQPAIEREALYVGEESGLQHLTAAGIKIKPYTGTLTAKQVLVVGPEGGSVLARDAASIADWLKSGGNIVAIGLDQHDLDFFASRIGVRKDEHTASS